MDALKPEDRQSKQWETTFAKTFSRHKNLFIKTSAIFQLTKDGARYGDESEVEEKNEQRGGGDEEA